MAQKKAKAETNAKKLLKLIQRKPTQTFQPTRRNINFIQRLQPAPALSREQQMIQEVFSGEGALMSGDGSCLPYVRERPTSFGFGNDRTANLFGLGNDNDDKIFFDGGTSDFFGL